MTKASTILLVEDSDDDAELAVRAFRDARITNPLVRTRDGVEALDFLFARGAYAERDSTELPVVVLLDLRLPRLDGIDVLREIRGHASTATLPVVLLTSSNHEHDRSRAYEHHVNSYVQKPVSYDDFVAAARQIGVYWTVLNLTAPPPRT